MKNKKVPMRTCIGCRESKSKKELTRMVENDGDVLIDRTGKANGRGIYLCASKDCFEKAKKKNAISRGLNVTLSEEQINKIYTDLFEE